MENSTLKINKLTCEYRTNPLGIDIQTPRLSWQSESARRGAAQTAYRLIAALEEDPLQKMDQLHWDSGKVLSDQSKLIPYEGLILTSRQRIYWRVRIWDEGGEISGWSDPAWFEMGLLDSAEWQAEWIGNPLVGGTRTPVPSPFFRNEFQVDREIESARLYITSLGIYEATLNGQRVGRDVFAPGWTDYAYRVQYGVNPKKA